METLKVIKIGGNIIDNDAELTSFLKEFASLNGPKILVHGGGKLATELSNKMNVPVKMIDGRRVTDAETLEIITMVYAGKINKNIVAKLQSFRCNAMGFSGADGNTIIAKKRLKAPINYGFVGDIVKVEVSLSKLLLNNGITNIYSAISHDGNGQLLNTNADTIASELAIAFSKFYEVELYYCFEKKGVLKDVEDSESVIEHMNYNSYQKFKKEGIINEGMIPKLENCFYALQHQVQKICVGKQEMLFDPIATFTTIKN